MIDLKNLDRWAEIKPGEKYEMQAENSRVITVTIRAERKTPIYLVGVKDGDVTFLANIDGYGKIKFRVPDGAFALVGGQDTPIYLTTVEMEKASVEMADAVIFTKVVERRARDPRFEEMMFRMQQNLERRLIQVRNEDNAKLEARRKSMIDEVREEAKAEVEKTKTEKPKDDDSKKSAAKPAGKPKGDDAGRQRDIEDEPEQDAESAGKAA